MKQQNNTPGILKILKKVIVNLLVWGVLGGISLGLYSLLTATKYFMVDFIDKAILGIYAGCMIASLRGCFNSTDRQERLIWVVTLGFVFSGMGWILGYQSISLLDFAIRLLVGIVVGGILTLIVINLRKITLKQ